MVAKDIPWLCGGDGRKSLDLEIVDTKNDT